MKLLVTPTIRELFRATLQHVPVAIWHQLFPKSSLGVCYHLVSDERPPHLKHYLPLDTKQFGTDLSYLTQRFGFIEYDELVHRRAAGNIARDSAAVLTFDDGFAECATVVEPILLRHKVECIFFIITDLIDNHIIFRESHASLCIDAILRRPVESVETITRDLGIDTRLRPAPAEAFSGQWGNALDVANMRRTTDARLHPLLHRLLTIAPTDNVILDQLCERLGVDAAKFLREVRPYLSTDQIRRLHADGFTIGAHSLSHRRLQDLPRADAEREIIESCRIIRELTGQTSVPFAFPYSGAGLDRAWLAELREKHDFIGLFFDTGGLCRDAPFVVQRVFGERVNRDPSLDAILRRAWAARGAWHRGG